MKKFDDFEYVVITDDEKMRIINTFEKRLEKAWEGMLPWLIRDTYKEISRYETPSRSWK